MKNFYKFLGIITIAAVIGFNLAGCDDGSDSSNSGNNNTGNNNTGGNNSSVLSGTYTGQGGYEGMTCTFSGSNYTINAYGSEYERGSYSITGSTVRFAPTWNNYNELDSYTGTLSGLNNSSITVQGMTFIKGSSNNGGSGNTSVTLSSVSANGSSLQTTTQLTLNFDTAISGLNASDITLSGVSGVNKGNLSGSGPSYTLGISGFSSGGTLSVAVVRSGYTISGSPKTVTIYYSTGSGGGGGDTKPNAPTGVTATAQSSSSISVSWDSVSGATSYRVYYEVGSSSDKNLADTVTGTSYTHTGLQASTTYYYYIKAVNSAGESGYSSYKSATTQSSSSGGGGTTEYILDQPTFGTCSKSGNSLTINWSLTTSGKTPNGLYTYTSPSNIIIQVYNGTSFDNIQTLSASARSFTLNNYTFYQYSPAGVSGNNVTIRVYCTSGSNAYNSKYATTTYYVGENYWSPSY